MIGPIEKGVALWARASYGRVLAEMDIDDSRLVTQVKEQKSLLRYGKQHGMKIVTRKEDGKGWRVWLKEK